MCTALPGTPRPGGGGGLGVGVGVILVLGLVSLGGLGPVVLLGVRPLVVGLVVVAQVLLVLEHLVAVLALEGVVVLVPLLVSLAVGDGVEDDSAKGTPEVKLLFEI